MNMESHYHSWFESRKGRKKNVSSEVYFERVIISKARHALVYVPRCKHTGKPIELISEYLLGINLNRVCRELRS